MPRPRDSERPRARYHRATRRPVSLAALAALAGCAGKTRPLDRGRPIEIDESFWRGTTFKQDSVRVESVDLVSALVATPAGREHVRAGSRDTLLVGAGLAAGSGLAEDHGVARGLAVGGLAACGSSLYFEYRGRSSFVAAAREYNAALPQPSPATPPSTRAAPPRARGPALSVSFAF